MAKKAGKAKSNRSKKPQVYGIDDMTNAIFDDVMQNPDAPASAKELTKKAIKTVLQAEQSLIMGAVANGDKVAYVGYGTFSKRDRSARKGRNPQTGVEIDIPAKQVPGFKPGKLFKDVVEGE